MSPAALDGWVVRDDRHSSSHCVMLAVETVIPCHVAHDISSQKRWRARSTPGAAVREQVLHVGKRRSSRLQRYEEDVENHHDAVNKSCSLPLSTPPRVPSASSEKTKKSSVGGNSLTALWWLLLALLAI
eukprot:gene10111-11194_t